jgi:DNA-binding transcriptional regulator YhcF (GntR family)
MIFTESTTPLSAAEKRKRHEWVQIGAKYLAAKKKNPALTVKVFCDQTGLKYETTSRAFRKHREDIKQFYTAINPNKTKVQWVKLGVEYLKRKESEGMSLQDFADLFDLNLTTVSRAFRKHRDDIIIAKNLGDAKSDSRKLTKKEREDQLKADFRTQVAARSSEPTPKNQKKSVEWFQSTMKQGIRGHQVHKPKVGRLYAFVYDAKHKDTLPYWDVYPLVVYLGMSQRFQGLMLGLNLHYIPPKARQEFLESLIKYSNTDRISNRTTLDVDWTKVKGMRGSKVMIKSYIPSRIKGTFIEIKPSDWVNVVYMPTSKFVSGPESKAFNVRKVWSKY